MEADFQTTEKPLFMALSDQELNRIYEDNSRRKDFMDHLKNDSDEDFGPETDVDAADDILVSPAKCSNPFSNDIGKRENMDCDDSHNLIDCSNQEVQNVNKDTVNINNFFKNSTEDVSTENLTVEENLDKLQIRPMNSYPADFTDPVLDTHGINFSNFSSNNNNDSLKELKLDANAENPLNQDFNDHYSSKTLNENVFIFDNEHSESEKCISNITNECIMLDEKATKNEIENDQLEDNQILCNGGLENHNHDKMNLERPISPIPAQTNNSSKFDVGNLEEDLITEVTNIMEESKNLPFESNDECDADKFEADELRVISPKEASENEVSSIADSTSDLNVPPPCSGFKTVCSKNSENEEEEILSPSSTHFDEKIKDEIVGESGGEVDSEDDEWNYYKVDSGASAQERVDLVAIPLEVSETEKPTMTTPLNPDAAEFIPVSPVSNSVDNDIKKTPIHQNVSRGLNDIIASSPNWNDMDHVEVPDETSFLTEVKSRPSNIFTESDLFLDNSGELGCTDLKHNTKDINPEIYKDVIVGESPVTQNIISESDVSPIQGIALANDMTSSFIDPSTMTSENEIINKEIESIAPGETPFKLESQSVLNVSAPEFKSEFIDHMSDKSQKLPDLLSLASVQDNDKLSGENLMETANQMTEPQLEENILDISQSPSRVKDSPIMDENSEIESPSSALPQASDSLLLEKQNFETNDVIAEADKISTNESVKISMNTALIDPLSGVAISQDVVSEKIDTPKKVTPTQKAAPGKITKSGAATKTPPSVTKSLPAVKKQTPTQLSKSMTSKTTNNTITSGTSIKSAYTKVTTTAKPVGSASAQRPSLRPRTTTTATKSATTTTTSAVKAPTSKLSPTKTSTTCRVTSTTTAPRPKPKVPSNAAEKKTISDGDSKTSVKRTEIVGKKPGITHTVSTTTRTVASRPTSAPPKAAAIKLTTTGTSTRTTSAKSRTVTSAIITTTTTRTILNSKKPLTVGDKSSKVPNKSLTKTFNGLANGKLDTTTSKTKKTSAITSTISKAEIENKTETKAENVNVENIQNDNENSVIENVKSVNLINGTINE